MLHAAAFKIDDLGVLAAKLDGYICLRRIVLQRCGHSDNFLDERHVKVFCQGQAAASRDDRGDVDRAQLVEGASEKVGQGLLDIRVMPFVVREEHLVFLVQNRNFNGCGTDVDPKSM